MQSETFKILIEKQKTETNEEKSDEIIPEVKENISIPKQMNKRIAIFLAKSQLTREIEDLTPTTPIPSIFKGNDQSDSSPDKFASLTNSRTTNYSPVKSSNANDKSKNDDSDSSDSSESYGKLELIKLRRNSNKLNFFRHRAPKISFIDKIKKMEKQVLMKFTSMKSQLITSIKMQ